MKKGITKLLSVAVLFMFFSSNVNAINFWKTGTIKRILTEGMYYSGCMVYLSVPIDNDCPSRWVSLDCQGKFYDKELGAQKLSNAIAAAHSGKTVSILVDNTKKANGYCVARRVDVLF